MRPLAAANSAARRRSAHPSPLPKEREPETISRPRVLERGLWPPWRVSEGASNNVSAVRVLERGVWPRWQVSEKPLSVWA